MSSLLDEIATWDHRATKDEAKYFFASPNLEQEIQGLLTGKKCFVVGAKGMGKSAVLERIKSLCGENAIILTNEFSPANLNDFCAQTANQQVRVDDLQHLWKYYIAAKTCLALAEKRLGPLRRFDLAAKYGLSAHRSWWQRIWRAWPKFKRIDIGGYGGVEFQTIDAPVDGKPSGLRFEAPKDSRSHAFLWSVQSDIAIDDAIKAQTLSKTKIFILFDEIDQALSQARDQQTFSDYLATVGALISSVYSLRKKFEDAGAQIYPIVAIRSDIYSYITHADKNALNAKMVKLAYNDESIMRELIGHRLATALTNAGIEFDRTSFSDLWKKTVNDTRSLDDQDSIYGVMRRRTLNRPRDYVQFLKLAASKQRDLNPTLVRISTAAVNAAGGEFSAHFLQEFRDELSFRYPFADRLIDVFKIVCPSQNANQFAFDTFVAACIDRGIDKDRGFLIDLAQYLFVISVFGTQQRVGYNTFSKLDFRYRNDNLNWPTKLSSDDVRFGLHTGFLRALFADEPI